MVWIVNMLKGSVESKIYTCIYIYTYIHTYICVYSNTHICIYTHIYVYIYTLFIYICVLLYPWHILHRAQITKVHHCMGSMADTYSVYVGGIYNTYYMYHILYFVQAHLGCVYFCLTEINHTWPSILKSSGLHWLVCWLHYMQ